MRCKYLYLLVLAVFAIALVTSAYADGAVSSVFVLPETIPVISTPFDQYSPTVNVEITGLNFTNNGNVNLSIYNSIGTIVNSSVFAANATGGFQYDWTAIAANDNYSINATDLTKLITPNKIIEILDPYNWSGMVFNASFLPEDSNVTVYIYNASHPKHYGPVFAVDDEIYQIAFNYGVRYVFLVEPNRIQSIKEFRFDWVANTGQIGNVLGIDDTPENNSDYKDWLEIVATYINLTNFEDYYITIRHSAASDSYAYKCTDWNFTERRCNNDSSWTQVMSITDGATETELNFSDPGDPGFGISTEPTPPGPTPPGRGSGGGGGATHCSPSWNCTEWSACVGGKQTRTCTDKWNCGTNESRPSEEKSCAVIREPPAKAPEKAPDVEPPLMQEIIKPLLKHVILIKERDYLRVLVMLVALAIVLIVLFDTSETLLVVKQFDGKRISILLHNIGKLWKKDVTNIVIVEPIKSRAPIALYTEKRKTIVKALWEMEFPIFVKHFFLEKRAFVAHVKDKKVIVLKDKQGHFMEIAPSEKVLLDYASRKAVDFEEIYAEYTRGKSDTYEELAEQYAIFMIEYKKIKDKTFPSLTSMIEAIKFGVRLNIPDQHMRRKVEEKLVLFELLFKHL